MLQRFVTIEFSLCVLATLCAADMSVAQTTQPAQEQSAEPQAQRREQVRSDRRRADGERRRRSNSRRTQRVKMEEVRVASPDGKIEFVMLPNAERLSYTVKLGDTTVIEPSTLSMIVDGYDLASGVAMGAVERVRNERVVSLARCA